MNPLAEISLSTLLMRLGAVLVLVTLSGTAVSAVARRLCEPRPAGDGSDRTLDIPRAERDPATVLRLAAELGALTPEGGS